MELAAAMTSAHPKFSFRRRTGVAGPEFGGGDDGDGFRAGSCRNWRCEEAAIVTVDCGGD